MDAVGHRLNDGVQELGGALPVSAVRQAGDRELRGPVDGNEQVELAFTRSNLSDVDVKEPDRIGLEPGPSGLVALDVGQARDAVALEAAVQAGPCQMRQ